MTTYSRITRSALGLTVAALFVFSTGIMANYGFAVNSSSVTVSSSNLSGGSITFSDFTPITLDGTLQTSTASWPISNVIDARGNGSGWNLSLTLTPLAEFNTATSTYVPSGKTLSAGSIKASTVPVISLADSSSSATTGMSIVALNTALDTGTPVKLIIAPALKGRGSYSLTNLGTTITIPADAYAVTYCTDATVALISGP